VTFSIVARCPRTDQLGVAAVTGTPGVGKLLTWARARVGAVATQSWINPYLGVDALSMLGNGHTAEAALQAVVSLDDDAALRQVGVVDAHGRSAAHTGDECAAWAGHRLGDGWAVQGNLLTGPETLDACIDAFLAQEQEDLVLRLVEGLRAGEAAGGDRRGSRSATAYVVASEHYPLWDLRADDHPHPIDELCRLHEVLGEELLPQVLKLPTRKNLVGRLTSDTHDGLA
jgi:uncharacterized Ntn-hydrolase superfamily protein